MYAFDGAYNILNVELGANVDAIGTFAFANTRFTSITLPATVKTIYESAFANSSLLKTVTFAGSDLVIKAGAFSGCAKFDSFNSTEKNKIDCTKVTSVGRNAFDFGNDTVYTHVNITNPEQAFGEQKYQ